MQQQLALLTLIFSAACGPLENDLSESRAALWTVGSTYVVEEWDSGHTNNLSGWRDTTCYTTYGSNYFLVAMQAWREPSANLDTFVARLKASCTEYVPYNGDDLEQDDSTKVTELVYEGNYRSETGTTEIFGDLQFPAQVILNLNAGSDYVRDLTLRRVHKSSLGDFLESYTNPDWTDFALGIGANFAPAGAAGTNDVVLTCPEQHVIVGMGLKYELSSGKIRRFKINCRTLTHD